MTVIQACSKPLFTWRKALSMSHDGKTLYDFAQYSLKNVHSLHQRLVNREFQFRECLELNYNFNGKPGNTPVDWAFHGIKFGTADHRHVHSDQTGVELKAENN